MTSTTESAALAPVLRLLFEGAEPGAWRKCVVTPARQAAAFVPWDKLTAQPVRLASRNAIKVVTRSGKKETTSTLTLEQWPERLREAIEAGPCHLDVLAHDHDWHARRTRDGRWLATKSRPSLATTVPTAPLTHDRAPQHPLPAGNPRARVLFEETGLFGRNGQLLGEGADKFRQVQHYIELLRHMPVWSEGRAVSVVDAGCGKAYLSLALCLWAGLKGSSVKLTGVDSSVEVIESVRGIAARTGIAADFHATSISEYADAREDPVDLLLSLHACDTATDEALAAGVRLGAQAIVLVPCCHHELVAQIEARSRGGELPAASAWQSTLRSGLLTHRLADIVTDTLRAEALEALGYKVDVLEFVSPEATAHNLMIRAVRRVPGSKVANKNALARYRALATEWGVTPALEGLLGNAWPPG